MMGRSVEKTKCRRSPVKRRRSSSSSSSSSSQRSSSTSTTRSSEAAKHYPQFDAAYAAEMSRSMSSSVLGALEAKTMMQRLSTSDAPFISVVAHPSEERRTAPSSTTASSRLDHAAPAHLLLLYGQYLFLKVLGKGTYSKVVLAQDLSVLPLKRVVAMKIFRGERAYDDAFRDEVAVQRLLMPRHGSTTATGTPGGGKCVDSGRLIGGGTDGAASWVDHPELLLIRSAGSLCVEGCRAASWLSIGARHCATMLDTITHRKHCAVVYPVLDATLLEWIQGTQQRGVSLDMVRSVAFQLLCVAFFLEENRVIHTDLKPENILLEDGTCGDHPLTMSIQVIDFGSARVALPPIAASSKHERRDQIRHSRHRRSPTPPSPSPKGDDVSLQLPGYSVIQTRHYRAPEVILHAGWGFPAEIWSIALILYELRTGKCAFMVHDDEEHLAMMERLLGPPIGGYYTTFGDQSTVRRMVSHSTGKLRWWDRSTFKANRYVDEVAPLHRALRDEDLFAGLLRQMLDWDPKRRLTPRQALSHPFFAGVASGAAPQNV